jgi:ERCC4-type nuclease
VSDGSVTVVADTCEAKSDVPRLLVGWPGLRVIVGRLPCGDYAVGDMLGIERKTADDLARSIVDGRFFRQLGSLRQLYRRPVLLVEGLADGGPVAGVPWLAVRGALVSAAVSFGIPVLRTDDRTETAGLIATAARQVRADVAIAYARPGFRPRGWRRRALYVLQGLPTVGPQRARSLLDRFGSVRGVVAAQASALAAVPGIGMTVARAISEAVGPERDTCPIRNSSPPSRGSAANS